MHGLVEGQGCLDLTAITKRYGRWLETNPVDVGYTTKQALQYADPKKPDPQKVMQAAMTHCSTSESNGSLMRATPMAVWSHKLPQQQAIFAIHSDVKFTHSLPSVANTVEAYVMAIRYLLNNPNDPDRNNNAFLVAMASANANACELTIKYLMDA